MTDYRLVGWPPVFLPRPTPETRIEGVDLDGSDVCHFVYPEGGTRTVCGIPRVEASRHPSGMPIQPPPSRGGRCRCGRRWCPNCIRIAGL
jgi:hypothetical protein